VIKTCAGCGKTYTRIDWDALPYKGVLAEGTEDACDIRDCAVCKSTMARPVGVIK
jgi:hypothetical protein